MFQFVYAWQPGESWETLTADGFVGIESAVDPPPGIRRVGGGAGDGEYVVVADLAGPAARDGSDLRRRAEGDKATTLLVPNAAPFDTAAQLWAVLEAADHPCVKAAIDLAIARSTGQTAAVLVPTLNLRIGLVRATVPQDDLTDYARRLAGIGYDGYVVCDPPPGEDRPAAARDLAARFRGIFPSKPVKKPTPAKPAKE